MPARGRDVIADQWFARLLPTLVVVLGLWAAPEAAPTHRSVRGAPPRRQTDGAVVAGTRATLAPGPCAAQPVSRRAVKGTTGTLFGVAAVAGDDVWAVGAGERQPLVEHWNGAGWSIVPSPPTGPGSLAAVAAVARDDVWAVGTLDIGAGRALIEHWDGVRWKIVAGPTPPGQPAPSGQYGYVLKAVAAAARDDVWAVGSTGGAPLAEHWDGRSWHLIRLRLPAAGRFGELRAVAAVTGRDVWAAGVAVETTAQPVLEHWDGQAWQSVPAPRAGVHYYSAFSGLAARSSRDVWAVGGDDDTTSGGERAALAAHWDGRAWRLVPVPPPGGNTVPSAALAAVAARSGHDVWAVGDARGEPLAVHWDGARWRVVPVPSAPNPRNGGNAFFGVAAVAAGETWAVGGGLYGTSSSPVLGRWDGARWSVCPTS